MARRPRNDAPDTWHHAMNRGLARRTIFESAADMRKFLALVAREVRRGRIELHAYSLLPNHFHLLIRSVVGELSRAMRRIQNGYARWFNRSRRRDGPLFKGRFLSRDIRSLEYRRNVVVYIHDNAIAAGLAADPAEYAWSSAGQLVRERRPPWLATAWIEDECSRRAKGEGFGDRLLSAFPCRVDADFRRHMEKQLHQRLPKDLEEDEVPLRFAGSPKVVRWMFRKAKLADGTKPFRPVSPANRVERLVAAARERVGPLLGLFKRRAKDAWATLRAGLLRLFAGCTLREIGLRADRHTSTCCRDVQDHLRLLRAAPGYERLAAELGAQIVAAARAA